MADNNLYFDIVLMFLILNFKIQLKFNAENDTIRQEKRR